MKRLWLFLALLCAGAVQAQVCEGGLYLNPQVIRGEGTAQTEGSMRELIEFMRPSGISVSPVLNIKDVQDVAAALKRQPPPCWVYGNPVVGLASGYRPTAVNVEPIEAAVLVLGDLTKAKDGKPVELKSLPPAEQARVLAKLKTTTCMGMKSGVTTELVRAEHLCGEVTEIVPQQGLGQNYLPTKAGFQWHADKWVGLITRVSSARSASTQNLFGTDERIHQAQLLIVPARLPSWGYGLYTYRTAPAGPVSKMAALLSGLQNPSPPLLRALDLGSKFEFAAPPEAAIQAMGKALAITP